MGERAVELGEWLIRSFVNGSPPDALLVDLLGRLSDFELDRVNWLQPTLHPLIRATTYIWRRSDDAVEVQRHTYEQAEDHAYISSPLPQLFARGEGSLRRRLCDPDTPRDYPILLEMDERGVTDYLAFAVTTGITPLVATWATVRPGGFDDQQVALLETLMPPIAGLLDAHRTRQAAETMLEVYVGRNAAQQIIRGDIRRGVGRTTRAVVWFSDLRDYSALSTRHPPEELIGILNVYFEHMAVAVHEHDGEVLKFLGDGMLAVFRGKDDAEQASRAVDAARSAVGRVGGDDLRVGITLHLGEVVYGNIGAPERLDFTVIGPAVNQVSRMQSSCARDRHSIVVSDEIATLLPGQARRLGTVELRGIGARELYEVGVPDRG